VYGNVEKGGMINRRTGPGKVPRSQSEKEIRAGPPPSPINRDAEGEENLELKKMAKAKNLSGARVGGV